MPAGQAPASAGAVLGRLSSTFIWCAIVLILVGGANLFGRSWSISDVFFVRQDIVALLAAAIILSVIARMSVRTDGAARLATAPPRLAIVALATGCGLVAWAGTFVVYDNFALSMDEFMARFDAVIFARGRLFGELPAAWAGYKSALQPIFQIDTPSPVHWSSSYLPVNAAVRAAGRLVGLESLVNPLWTALGVFATWAVGRRLWPERPGTAFAAAILAATSSQVLVNGMTAYAMPAHLALNMVWLWGFARGGRAGHATALAAGIAATGLHQLVFHPLFVAPFVLQLWLDRRWRLALLYTAAYALIGLFWASWWNLAFAVMGFGQPVSQMGADGLAIRALGLIAGRELGDVALMARNLARFVAWQNPFATALAVLGAVAAFRAKGMMRALLLSIVVTTVAVAVILPFQGHGWGYRYLHGVIGTMGLLAAWTWDRLTAGLDPAERRAAEGGFAAVALLSMLAALPTHAWQVHSFVTPYARAAAAIARTDADVVLVDERGIWYGQDLVRNDPFLRNRPVVLRLADLNDKQRAAFCTRYKIAIYDRNDAADTGVRLIKSSGSAGPHRARPNAVSSHTLPSACRP
jgi:hypothetical protein